VERKNRACRNRRDLHKEGWEQKRLIMAPRKALMGGAPLRKTKCVEEGGRRGGNAPPPSSKWEGEGSKDVKKGRVPIKPPSHEGKGRVIRENLATKVGGKRRRCRKVPGKNCSKSTLPHRREGEKKTHVFMVENRKGSDQPCISPPFGKKKKN